MNQGGKAIEKKYVLLASIEMSLTLVTTAIGSLYLYACVVGSHIHEKSYFHFQVKLELASKSIEEDI